MKGLIRGSISDIMVLVLDPLLFLVRCTSERLQDVVEIYDFRPAHSTVLGVLSSGGKLKSVPDPINPSPNPTVLVGGGRIRD